MLIKKIYKSILAIVLSVNIYGNAIVPVLAQEFTSGMEETYGEDAVFSAVLEEEIEEAFTGNELEIFSEEGQAFSDHEEETEGEEESSIDYIRGRELTEEEIQIQELPFSELTAINGVPEIEDDSTGIMRKVNYPVKYDARDENLITSVKEQDPYGLCWAFSLASVLETSLLKQGYGAYDLSEEHVAYFFANRAGDPLGNTEGDYNVHYVLNKEGVRDYHESGNNYLASLFLSTWSGMTLDKDFPLETNDMHTLFVYKNWDPNYAYGHNAAYLSNAIFANYNKNIARTKQLVMEYGSLSFMLNMNTRYFNANTAAYCYDTTATSSNINHIMTIVGWDDEYSKENFKTYSNVTADGAWIVKNSWGVDWGKDGYCYVSYEDPTISALMTGTARVAQEYQNNYFYDGSSSGASEYIKKEEKAANIFKAKTGKVEVLGEIETMSYKENSRYAIQIYIEVDDLTNPESGKAAYSEPFIYTQRWAGTETIDIPDVYIPQNTYYSIVIANADNTAIKYGIDAPSTLSGGWITYYTEEEQGQSFKYSNGQWIDLASARKTMRIKGHTKTLEELAGITLSLAEITLNKGEEYKLQASSVPDYVPVTNLEYQSSDPSIVTVDAKTGVVKAIESGIVKITCFSKSNPEIKAVSEVIVLKNEPTNIKAVATNKNRIIVSWSKVNGADGYIIYRQLPGKEFTKYAVVSAEILSYTATKEIKIGENNNFYVAAYKKDGTDIDIFTRSGQVSAKTAFDKTLATIRTDNKIRNSIAWSKIEGAEGYYVYRRSGTSSWKKIKTVQGNKSSSYKIFDTNVKSLQKYQYMIRAYCTLNGKIIQSPYSCSGIIITAPIKPVMKSFTSKYNGINLTWSGNKNCTGYVIYRRVQNGQYKKIAQINKGNINTYLDKTAKKGVKYIYCIKAYVKEFYGTVFSEGSYRTAIRR